MIASTAVKLVNVAAPAADECLHAEARKMLGQLLPEGAQVTVTREGPFAALSTQDGKLVGAALIGEGLAVPTVNGIRFLDQAKEANNAAVDKRERAAFAGRAVHVARAGQGDH